ncbi:unnamed protein product [Gordionus sp. m RMFG-2023]|uniref:uncharacterized protein LOC135923512 n=1 Tax=Gordionus sp. m RMFG-2023 TaxID=3053472 RepID=UPI0030E24214
MSLNLLGQRVVKIMQNIICEMKITLFYYIILVHYSFLTGNVEKVGAELMLIRAQCESHCIYQLGYDNSTKNSKLNGQAIYKGARIEDLDLRRKCQYYTECSACSKPCTQPFSEFSSCLDHCKSLTADRKKSCMDSCAFLRDISINKVGNCPSIQQMSGFALACIESCQKDSDCNGIQKCCSHRCGRTCQYPETITEDVPPKPLFTAVNKELEKDGEGRTVIQLSWTIPATYFQTTSNNNVSISSILYVVQSQLNVESEKKPANHHLSEWRDMAITNNMKITIKEYLPSSWIRFRVASINPNGTLGFSEPSGPVIIKSGINAPQMPSNLTIGEYTVQKSGKISQIIHWNHPKSDLPVIKYKIMWSGQNIQLRNAGSADESALKQFKKVIQGSLTSIALDNLDPDTTYFIQVQAYSQKGPLKFRGEKSSIFLTTPNIYDSDFDNIKVKLLGIKKFLTEDRLQYMNSARSKLATTTISNPKSSTVASYDDSAYENEDGIDEESEYLDTANPEASTASLNQAASPIKDSDESPVLIKIANITVGDSFYQNGVLKAKVIWRTMISPKSGPTPKGKWVEKYRVTWHPQVCIEGASQDKITLSKSPYPTSKTLTSKISNYPPYNSQTDNNRYALKEQYSYADAPYLTLQGLKFKCRYEISITPYPTSPPTMPLKNAALKAFKANFQTPSCAEVQSRSQDKGSILDCPISVPVPAKPRNLTSHIYHIEGNNITTLITWRPPRVRGNHPAQNIPNKIDDATYAENKGQEESSDPNVIGYRLVFYGKRGVNMRLPNSDSNADQTSSLDKNNNIFIKVFSPFQTSFYLTNLLHDRDYAVDIQAFSEAGPGSISHVEFRTPKIVDENRLYHSAYYGVYPRHYSSRDEGSSSVNAHLRNRKSGFTNFKEPGSSNAWRAIENADSRRNYDPEKDDDASYYSNYYNRNLRLTSPLSRNFYKFGNNNSSPPRCRACSFPTLFYAFVIVLILS